MNASSKSDQNVEGGLCVGEHLGWIEELGEGCELVGDRLLEKIVGHLLLTGADQVALIVGSGICLKKGAMLMMLV